MANIFNKQSTYNSTLFAELDGGEWQVSDPGSFTSAKKKATGTH
jgi:hypothetical protein